MLNDDGTQQSWISEKVVYEGKIKINEPMFFSLTIPEDTARVCLFMKRPWDVSWFTWPITDQAPFYVSGDTFRREGAEALFYLKNRRFYKMRSKANAEIKYNNRKRRVELWD